MLEKPILAPLSPNPGAICSRPVNTGRCFFQWVSVRTCTEPLFPRAVYAFVRLLIMQMIENRWHLLVLNAGCCKT